MRYVAAMLFCAATGMAQQVTSPDKLPAAVSGFDDSQGHKPLPCSVQPVKPTLNFGFRFQTGYIVETSLDAYLGGRHHWYIVFNVTPENGLGQATGQPVYFSIRSICRNRARPAFLRRTAAHSRQAKDATTSDGAFSTTWAVFAVRSGPWMRI